MKTISCSQNYATGDYPRRRNKEELGMARCVTLPFAFCFPCEAPPLYRDVMGSCGVTPARAQ